MTTRRENPAPLTAAASLVAVEGVALIGFAALELASLSAERASLGISVAIFFLAYGALLMVCSAGLVRRSAWTRGPVLMTQLIALGIAWYARDVVVVAVLLAVSAVVVLAGILHPATLEALESED